MMWLSALALDNDFVDEDNGDNVTWPPVPGVREVDVQCETIFRLPRQPSPV